MAALSPPADKLGDSSTSRHTAIVHDMAEFIPRFGLAIAAEYVSLARDNNILT
ncbi:MAG: hypothetical protein OEY93_10670 [Anaerolineae bacterium]|nr:hypothetical protein [Anaerolineae bacterium]